jgi:hypothetical protein
VHDAPHDPGDVVDPPAADRDSDARAVSHLHAAAIHLPACLGLDILDPAGVKMLVYSRQVQKTQSPVSLHSQNRYPDVAVSSVPLWLSSASSEQVPFRHGIPSLIPHIGMCTVMCEWR